MSESHTDAAAAAADVDVDVDVAIWLCHPCSKCQREFSLRFHFSCVAFHYFLGVIFFFFFLPRQTWNENSLFTLSPWLRAPAPAAARSRSSRQRQRPRRQCQRVAAGVAASRDQTTHLENIRLSVWNVGGGVFISCYFLFFIFLFFLFVFFFIALNGGAQVNTAGIAWAKSMWQPVNSFDVQLMATIF